MAGFTVVNIPSGPDGCVDLDALRAAVGPDTAGLMLTNPNTVGLFDKNILEITRIVHEAGGLCYYDGANLNAVMGIARPGDMGFDVHAPEPAQDLFHPARRRRPRQRPGGLQAFLAPFLPGVRARARRRRQLALEKAGAHSVGNVRAFYGNFLVAVRALTYILMLGREGIPEAARKTRCSTRTTCASSWRTCTPWPTRPPACTSS
jgi:glycine dehydrogenase subunit 2